MHPQIHSAKINSIIGINFPTRLQNGNTPIKSNIFLYAIQKLAQEETVVNKTFLDRQEE